MKRTGLKVAYWKVIKFINYPHNFLYRISPKFPERGVSPLNNTLWLYTLINEIKSIKLNKTSGFLHATPHPETVDVWKKLLDLNPNNLGTWAGNIDKYATGTGKAETILISKIINLLGGKTGEWCGYVTSGATEANIFSAWIGRNYLKGKNSKGKICLLLNQLTHYSIKKAANIVGVEVFETEVDRSEWIADPDSLESKIGELKRLGYTGFLIPLTLGYTQTGTNDNVSRISDILTKIQKELKINVFLWIDAAINGLVLPFTQSNFLPLTNRLINSFILDFHKTGMCPTPSGLIVYKSGLTRFIDQEVPYLDQKDTTLLGSRTGIAAAAMLVLINTLGKVGFRKIILESIFHKREFISMIKKTLPNLDLEIIDQKEGISLALITRHSLPVAFVRKHGLYAKRWTYRFRKHTERLYIYKANFLPKP